MKKFLFVLLAVLIAIAVLAACAPAAQIEDGVAPTGIVEFTKSLPDRMLGEDHAIPMWVIIVGAVIVFLIGFGLIWKLIPGFIKIIALLVLAGAIAGAAYGLWTIPAYDKAKEIYEDVTEASVVVEDYIG